MSWDSDAGEWSFTYGQVVAGKSGKKAKECTIKREVWFADARSALMRAKITPQFRIGGIAVWDFGTVESDFYSRLADYGREIAPAKTTVTITAPKSRVHGTNVKIEVVTESSAGVAKGATATLTFIPKANGAARSEVATITLDKSGSGTFTVPAEASGSWVVSVDGDWYRKAGSSEPVATRVRYGVRASADAAKVKAKTAVTLSASVSPAMAGTEVVLQRRGTDTKWADLRTAVTDADGKVSETVTPSRPGEVSYRYRVGGSDSLLAGRSTKITITVTK